MARWLSVLHIQRFCNKLQTDEVGAGGASAGSGGAKQRPLPDGLLERGPSIVVLGVLSKDNLCRR
jgi:hypothetical protein